MPRRKLSRPQQIVDLPASVLKEFPEAWESRATRRIYGMMTITIPAPADILAAKLRRNEPRDRIQRLQTLPQSAQQIGIV